MLIFYQTFPFGLKMHIFNHQTFPNRNFRTLIADFSIFIENIICFFQYFWLLYFLWLLVVNLLAGHCLLLKILKKSKNFVIRGEMQVKFGVCGGRISVRQRDLWAQKGVTLENRDIFLQTA